MLVQVLKLKMITILRLFMHANDAMLLYYNLQVLFAHK